MRPYPCFHFYRIGPNWRVREEKPSCCLEWNILILWLSGKHLKVVTHNICQNPIVRQLHYITLSCDIRLWLFRLNSGHYMIVFVQLMTSCVLLWSTAAEETCSRWSNGRKRRHFVLMMYASQPAIILHLCVTVLLKKILTFFPDFEMVCTDVCRCKVYSR